jgi:glycosyltransferase involved in cell wall biosynthesis
MVAQQQSSSATKVLVIAERTGSLPYIWTGWMLAQAGLRMHFVYQTGSAATQFMRERNLSVDELPFSSRFDLWSLIQLRRILRQQRPDIIHAYTAKTCWLAFWAQWPRRPAKLVFHRGAARRSSRWSPNDRLLFYGNRVDAYDCISNVVAQSLIEMGVPAAKILVNHLGYKLEWYAPQELPANFPKKTARFRLVCVANYRKVKGLEILMQAADLLEGCGFDFELLLVGHDRKNELAPCLERAASRRRIRLTGPIPQAWRVMRTCDCVVMPSLQEAFGGVAVEALACGVPLVASNVGGLKEIVEPEVTGLLVPPGEPGQLAQAIQRVLSDAALCKKFREQGPRAIETRFNLESARDRLLDLYRRLQTDSERQRYC